MYFFRLIRFQNILIIALAQYLLRFFVLKPFFAMAGLSLQISEFNFFLIVLSTALIAAGGYIINDIYDLEIDLHNKPDKVIVGKNISALVAKRISIAFSGLGIIIGIYLTYVMNVRPVALVNLICSGLLWFYSQSYKHIFLTGNIIISFLCGLSLFIVVFSENDLIYTINHLNIPLFSDEQHYLRLTLKIAFIYSAFAFAVSMVREIVKDIQDMEGDMLHGSKTMPVMLGVTKSKILALMIILSILVSIVRIQIAGAQWENKIIFGYTLFVVEIPLLASGIFIALANTKKQFTYSSLMLKMIMLTGILSMYIYNRYSV